MIDPIDTAIQQVNLSNALPTIGTIPTASVNFPIDAYPELIKQRALAKAQDIQSELASKKIELLQNQFSKMLTLVPSLPTLSPTVAVALALLKKPRQAISDLKIKAKLDIAKQKKKLTDQAQSETRSNIQKSLKAYKFPLKPK
jgi:hypothetical protein